MTTSETTATPPNPVTFKRLRNSLVIAQTLRPEAYTEWANESSFYAYQDAMGVYMDEYHFEPWPRTGRENLCLKASGLMIATYWMDIHPGRGIPRRETVEWLFRAAAYDEKDVIRPLTTACADDMTAAMNPDQRARMRDADTFVQLEPLLDELDPGHRNGIATYVWPRSGPVTRAHIASVLQPTVAELSLALENEGHAPLDPEYVRHIRKQLP